MTFQSKATNSYELIDEVVNIISEEPHRLWMDTWRAMVEGQTFGAVLPFKAPECGMVCCVGGWISTLRPGILRLFNFPVPCAWELEDIFHDFPDDKMRLKPGTQAYVDYVVANLQQFQATHEDALKAFTLTPVSYA